MKRRTLKPDHSTQETGTLKDVALIRVNWAGASILITEEEKNLDILSKESQRKISLFVLCAFPDTGSKCDRHEDL